MSIRSYKDNFKFVVGKFKGVALTLVIIGAGIVAAVVVLADAL